jgi:hypothetical protein
MTDRTPDPRNLAGNAEEAVVLPAREARQATSGRRVRTVLIAGIALIVVAFAVIYVLFPT